MHSSHFVRRFALSLVAVGALVFPLGGCGGGGSDDPEMISARFENFTAFTLIVSVLNVADNSDGGASPMLGPGDSWEISLEAGETYDWIAFIDGPVVVDNGGFVAGNALVVFVDAAVSRKALQLPAGFRSIFLDTDTCATHWRAASDVALRHGVRLWAYSSGGVGASAETGNVTLFEDRAAMVSHMLANVRAGDIAITADGALAAACESAGARTLVPGAHRVGPMVVADFAKRLDVVLAGR